MPDKNTDSKGEVVLVAPVTPTDPFETLRAEFKKQIDDLRGEMRTLENRLHARISVAEQKLTSPTGTFATKKPKVGDTVPGVPGKVVSVHTDGSVVTRGEDPQ